MPLGFNRIKKLFNRFIFDELCLFSDVLYFSRIM